MAIIMLFVFFYNFMSTNLNILLKGGKPFLQVLRIRDFQSDSLKSTSLFHEYKQSCQIKY